MKHAKNDLECPHRGAASPSARMARASLELTCPRVWAMKARRQGLAVNKQREGALVSAQVGVAKGFDTTRYTRDSWATLGAKKKPAPCSILAGSSPNATLFITSLILGVHAALNHAVFNVLPDPATQAQAAAPLHCEPLLGQRQASLMLPSCTPKFPRYDGNRICLTTAHPRAAHTRPSGIRFPLW